MGTALPITPGNEYARRPKVSIPAFNAANPLFGIWSVPAADFKSASSVPLGPFAQRLYLGHTLLALP